MQDVVQFMAVSRRHDNPIRCGRSPDTKMSVVSFDKHTLFIILALKRGLISPGLSNSSGRPDHDRPLHVSSSLRRRRLQMNEEVEKGEERRTDFSVPLNSPTHFPFRVPLRPPRSRVTTERAREEQILSPSVRPSFYLCCESVLRGAVANPPAARSDVVVVVLQLRRGKKFAFVFMSILARSRPRHLPPPLPAPPRAVFAVLPPYAHTPYRDLQ